MAIGDWDDTRLAAIFRQPDEHEEFDETAEDQWRLLVGYDRLCSAIGEELLSFTNVAWTEADWYTIVYIREGLAWDCLGAWIYVDANVGTNYLRIELRDQFDNVLLYMPDATGITIGSTGWKQISKCSSPTFSESNLTAMSVAIMGRCPAGNMDVGYLQLYLTSALEP